MPCDNIRELEKEQFLKYISEGHEYTLYPASIKGYQLAARVVDVVISEVKGYPDTFFVDTYGHLHEKRDLHAWDAIPRDYGEVWSPDAPNKPGLWWLYGHANYGCMGGHFTHPARYLPEPRLHLVTVATAGSPPKLFFSTDCEFIYARFDRAKPRQGWLGYWRKCSQMPVYTDPLDLFKPWETNDDSKTA